MNRYQNVRQYAPASRRSWHRFDAAELLAWCLACGACFALGYCVAGAVARHLGVL